jgi:hypothetical protein
MLLLPQSFGLHLLMGLKACAAQSGFWNTVITIGHPAAIGF